MGADILKISALPMAERVTWCRGIPYTKDYDRLKHLYFIFNL